MSDYLRRPLPLRVKAHLVTRAWKAFLAVRFELRRHALPLAVQHLGEPTARRGYRLEPAHLGRVVRRSLHIPRHEPRCLFGALVLYRLLTDQGDRPELVIGVGREAKNTDAHAWVELDGRDVGPPPGSRAGYVELVRYTQNGLMRPGRQ